jgi:hypothetical protein
VQTFADAVALVNGVPVAVADEDHEIRGHSENR